MMVLVPDPELRKLPQGFIVQCAQCVRAIDARADGRATCTVSRLSVDLNVPRICSSSEERR